MGIYVTDASGNRKKVAGIGKIKEIPDGSITGDKLADDTITTSKLIDDSVTWSKLAVDARYVGDNLLDNWCFVNLVDQKSGWMVKPGSPYLIPGTNTEAGTTTTYVKVIGWAGTIGASNCYIKIDGTKYVTNRMYAVRGYCEAGYTIDRWFIGRGTLSLSQFGVSFLWNGSLTDGYIQQRIEKSRIYIERVYTLSALTVDNELITATMHVDDPKSSFEHNVAFGFTSNETTVFFSIHINRESAKGLVAAKLELGDHQTLAHQDENGNWVLNEISDYDAELDKCQHYLFDPILDGEAYAVVGSVYNYSSTNKYVEFVIDLPNMRTIPTVIMDGSFQLLSGSNVYPVTNMHLSGSQNSRSKILLTVDTESVLPAGAYRLRRGGNVSSKLLFNSEL